MSVWPQNVGLRLVGLFVGCAVRGPLDGGALGLHVCPAPVGTRVGALVAAVGLAVGLHVCPANVGPNVGSVVGLSVCPAVVGACVVGARVGRPRPHAQHAWMTATLSSPLQLLPAYPPAHQLFCL